jgi:glyoxylase-like metal-dependent hydrolase (beta-lactamase superfamily II)
MAVEIPFDRAPDLPPGEARQVSPLIRRLVAPNPSAFTFHGTGTYIVGRGKVAVIDPGPMIESHLQAILDALPGESVSHVLVTHTHVDHSPLARPLQRATSAPVWGCGPHGSGRHEQGVKVEEGGDMAFAPDRQLAHGDVVEGAGWTLVAVHTPGHTSNHLCFALREERALFTGDHVMGWSTSVISPPDGDMRAYMASLDLLQRRDDAVYWPTHGGPIRDPKPFVAAFIAHRREREAAILACLEDGIARIAEMVPRIYGNTIPAGLYPAAARSVFAHVIDLAERGAVRADGPVAIGAAYRLAY